MPKGAKETPTMQTTTATADNNIPLESVGLTINTITTVTLKRYQVVSTYTHGAFPLLARHLHVIAAMSPTDAAEIIWRSLDKTLRESCAVTLTVRHPSTGALILETCKPSTAS